jgi:hypothetical protein
MSTEYGPTLTLTERIEGAELILVGIPGMLTEIIPDATEGQRRVFGIFQFAVERTMKGELSEDRLLVRVLGEGEDERARWLLPIEEGRSLVCLLTPDVGPDLPHNVYAPVAASGFLLEGEGVLVPEDAFDDLTRQITGAEAPPIPLDGFVRLVDTVVQRRAQQLGELRGSLPEDILDRPYPPVEEMPQDVREMVPAPPGAVTEGGRSAEVTPPEESEQ